MSDNNFTPTTRILMIIVWLQAWVALLGSLYFSEIAKYPPCVLCWYQRIAMYPLAIIFIIGLLTKDVRAFIYGLPLAIFGWIVAFYHTLLYHKIIPEPASLCVDGISCTTEQVMFLGFISIPLMSLVGFTIIIVCSILALRLSKISEQP